MSINPVALITGASRGIGKAIAYNFAKLGYDVALVARDEVLLKEVSETIKANYKVNTGIFALDVADIDSVDAAVNKIIAVHGRIDVLFNNAGVLSLGTSTINPLEFQRLLDVNIKGVYHFIHAIVPHMKKQKSGYIMNLSSMAGKRASESTGAYALTKYAVCGFNEALFYELLEHNVKVTALCPSVIATDMTKRIPGFADEEKIQLEDIVETVNYLLKLGSNALVKEIEIYNRQFSIRSSIKINFNGE